MSQRGARKETEQKQLSVAFNYRELRTIEAKNKEDTLQNKSAFSTNRIGGRGGKEDTVSLDFSTSKGTEGE